MSETDQTGGTQSVPVPLFPPIAPIPLELGIAVHDSSAVAFPLSLL